MATDPASRLLRQSPKTGRRKTGDPPTESTATLIDLARSGDEQALDRLFRRYLPALERWGRSRLPDRARNIADTGDIVQITLVKTLERVKEFKPERKGAFFAYLRKVFQSKLYDQLRAAKRKRETKDPHDPVGREASPLEEALGSERLAQYEKALEGLNPQQREAVIMRVELGSSYAEIAEVLGSPSANAARMVVSRGLVRMAEEMDAE